MNTPHPPGLPTMAALLLAAALVSWLGIAGPLVRDFSEAPYQTLKDFQTVIGATLAGFGLYVAWRNVSRQINQAREGTMIALISREEDRIRTELPGLIAASRLLYRFRKTVATTHVTTKGELVEEGLFLRPEELRKEITLRLEETDPHTRLLTFRALLVLVEVIRTLHETSDLHVDQTEKAVLAGDRQLSTELRMLDLGHEMVDSTAFDIDLRIDAAKARLPLLRNKIEAILSNI